MSVTEFKPLVAASLTPRQRGWSLAAVILSTFGVGMAVGIGYPLTSLTFERWGVAPWLTGVAGGVSAFATLVLLPVFPRWVARWGAMRAMVSGCFIMGGAFLLMPVFPDPWAWIALRFLMGAGLTLPWLVGETWINTVALDAHRGRLLAAYSMTLFSGFATGPWLLGGVGTEGWTPFLLGTAGIVLAVLPIVAAASLAPDLAGHSDTGVAGAARMVPVAMWAGSLGGLLETAHFSLLPLVALKLGESEAQALQWVTAFIVGGIGLQWAVGWLADRASAQRILVASGVLVAVVVVSLPWVTAPAGRWVVVLLMGGLSIGFYTLGLTYIGQQVRARDLGVANAAFLIAYQLGSMAGPTVGGFAISAWGVHGFVAAMALSALLGAGAIARVKRAGPGAG